MAKANLNTENFSEEPPVKAVAKKSSAGTKILLVLFIILLAGFVWLFINYRASQNKLTKLSTPEGQQELAKNELQTLLSKVGKLIVLPVGEEPTVAVIADVETLIKEQPFYKGAHNGDLVLIYVKAQKAIVYDQKNNVLINVGPVYVQDPKNNPTTDTTKNVTSETPKASPITLEVRNGSNQTGLAKTVADSFLNNPLYSVLKVGTATKNDYQKTVLVNLQGKDLSDLAKKFNVEVVTKMPAGEASSSADVVIILGGK